MLEFHAWIVVRVETNDLVRDVERETEDVRITRTDAIIKQYDDCVSAFRVVETSEDLVVFSAHGESIDDFESVTKMVESIATTFPTSYGVLQTRCGNEPFAMKVVVPGGLASVECPPDPLSPDFRVVATTDLETGLPLDLVEFLNQSPTRKLEFTFGEIRNVTLFPANNVALRSFNILDLDDGEKRFSLEGYDLVETCDNHQPEGIMVWFPTRGEYGQWDSDHGKALTFPDTNWTSLVRNASRYFNCLWYDSVQNTKVVP